MMALPSIIVEPLEVNKSGNEPPRLRPLFDVLRLVSLRSGRSSRVYRDLLELLPSPPNLILALFSFVVRLFEENRSGNEPPRLKFFLGWLSSDSSRSGTRSRVYRDLLVSLSSPLVRIVELLVIIVGSFEEPTSDADSARCRPLLGTPCFCSRCLDLWRLWLLDRTILFLFLILLLLFLSCCDETKSLERGTWSWSSSCFRGPLSNRSRCSRVTPRLFNRLGDSLFTRRCR
mmetsp:Transcript_33867/g.70780  ORF Transcript_33867/g.70780 Transcript_33867/m.70780 type:complete len:231 (+) Transcript_33867:4661-5353(+)